jgi:ribosomal protein S3
MKKSWKLKYFEKSNDESHINIHRSLEIEHYYKQLLKKNGFNLFNFKLNFTNYVLTVFFCIYTKDIQQGKKDLNLKKNNKFGFLKNSLKSLSIYMGNKFKIILKIRNASSSLKSNNLSKTLFNLNFDRFKIPEMKKLYLILATQTNSTELLGNFIAKQLKITKRHNFFFSLLNKSLSSLIKQKDSRIKGLKVSVSGRLNNALRSQSRTLKIGQIPLMTKDMKIEYAESTSFTSNGTIGVKVWVNHKQRRNLNNKLLIRKKEDTFLQQPKN